MKKCFLLLFGLIGCFQSVNLEAITEQRLPSLEIVVTHNSAAKSGTAKKSTAKKRKKKQGKKFALWQKIKNAFSIKGKDKSNTILTIGIISLGLLVLGLRLFTLLWPVAILGFILGWISFSMGLSELKKGNKNRKVKTGFVLSCITVGIGLTVLLLISYMLLLFSGGRFDD